MKAKAHAGRTTNNNHNVEANHSMKTIKSSAHLLVLMATVMGCLSIAGCASTAPKLEKVTDPNRLYEFSDFAAHAPLGQDWYGIQSLPQDPIHRLMFHKKFAVSQLPATIRSSSGSNPGR
jgi:hypothetical protein